MFEKIKSNKKVIAAGLALSIGGLTLSGCSEDVFAKGGEATVVAHEYDDPDSWTTIALVGKVPIIMNHYDRAHYYLMLEQCGREGDEQADENGCVYGEIEVNKSQFDSFEDGDEITLQTNK